MPRHLDDQPVAAPKGVPYALNASGTVALPETASPQEHYRCLACDELVSPVRAHTRKVGRANGRIRTVTVRAHFSHRRESQCVATGESILHLACKRSVQQSLERHRGLSVLMTCQNCAEPAVFVQGLGLDDRSETEVRIGEYRADVAVVGESRGAEFVVEVRFTHQVSECKALDLDVPWVEVQASAELLNSPHQPLTLLALNTNLFFHQPCECGNDAASYLQARERRKVRLVAEEQQRLAEHRQHQRARFEAEAERQRQEGARRRLEWEAQEALARLTRQQREAERQRALQQIEAFLQEHVLDVNRRLLLYTCVLAACPGCGVTTVFFDSSGMNMMPTWSRLAWQKSAHHPWEAVCPACGWHGPAPKSGERITFQGSHEQTTRTSLAPEPSFWWQNED